MSPGLYAHTKVTLPPVAVATCHAPGMGVHEPSVLWEALFGIHRDSEGTPLPTRVLIADPTLASLPSAIAAWGRDRVCVSVVLTLPLPAAEDRQVLLLARTAPGYSRLCRFLSLIAEDPLYLPRWLGSGVTPQDPGLNPCLEGVVALVRDDTLGALLASTGAEVHWRCHQVPDDEGHDWPGVWIPVVSMLTQDERRHDPIRRALATRASRQMPISDALSLDDLAGLAASFDDRPDLIVRAHELVESCGEGVPDGALQMPPSHAIDAAGELRTRAWEGARWRYGDPPSGEVTTRLDRELETIVDKGFAGYLLTVADLAAGRRTCGRGSGASSLVVYCLGITQVDPIRYHLLFERFLSPSRTDPPDLDVDFPWDERDDVLRAALDRYGREHVAMVSTHQRLRPKGALRSVARAWGFSDRETSSVTARLRGQRRYGVQANLPAPWPDLMAEAEAVEGLHLYDGLHCGGLVITPVPIRELVPVHPAAKEIDVHQARWEEPSTEPVPAIAWEKDGAEAMGLVKIDILGNRSLAVIRDAIADLGSMGVEIDEANWHPEDDPETCTLVASGRTMGCFYIESPAMRQLQAKAASGELDRLVVHSSIIRPAASNWIDEYLSRLHHWRRTGRHEGHWYPHPSLRGLLSESFGILSYQEDVMMVSQEVAGFTERQANQLRKALGHWDTQQRLLRFSEEFTRGAQARGVRSDVAAEIWDMVRSFSGYSFAKAHSASYALVSFQCAWLKAHYPAVFLARVIANEGGFYQPGAYIEEARRFGAVIAGPCLLRSAWKTAPEGLGTVRLGLHLVPLVSRRIAEAIVRERERDEFLGIGDLVRRTHLPQRTLVSLAECGALDPLRPDLDRDQVRWVASTLGLDAALRSRARKSTEPSGTTWLFPHPEWIDPQPPAFPLPDARREEFRRFRYLGICPERHPVEFCRRPDDLRAKDLASVPTGALVAITGIVVTRRQLSAGSKRKPMAFVTLEDETGLIESVWFPPAYQTYGTLLDQVCPLRLQGFVDLHFGQPSFVVQVVEALGWEFAG